MIKALTILMIKADSQPIVDAMELLNAVRQKLVPESIVLGVTLMEQCRFFENSTIQSRMSFRKSQQSGVGLNSLDLLE